MSKNLSIIKDTLLSSTAKVVYWFLLEQYGLGLDINVKNANLAKELGMSDSSIKRALRVLNEHCYIDITTITLVAGKDLVTRKRDMKLT